MPISFVFILQANTFDLHLAFLKLKLIFLNKFDSRGVTPGRHFSEKQC